jgi:PHD/YefM family antitoxin component YafN of YafNO toxin-antitoxin module
MIATYPEALMATVKPCVTTAGELVRKFSYYSEISLEAPVVIAKNGRPCNVLISIKEFERLKTRDQQGFLAADTPEQFLAEIETLASGEED